MTRRMPGPGDPETWGPPTGHPNDPRTEEPYGPCDVCEQESTQILDWGKDEDGKWITFRCEDCEALIGDMEEEPVEMARRYRLRERWVDHLIGTIDHVEDAAARGGIAFALNDAFGTRDRIQVARKRGL